MLRLQKENGKKTLVEAQKMINQYYLWYLLVKERLKG